MKKRKNNQRVYSVDDNYFNIINPEQAWILGILASDGFVKEGRFICIGQSGKHGLKLIKKIVKLLKFKGKIYKSETGYQPFYHIQINSAKIFNELKKYNIVSRKSLIYTFPSNLPQKMIPHFVAGYIDGDGSVGVYKSSKYVKTIHLSVVGTEKFITKLNKILPIKSTSIRKLKAKNCFELRWYGTNAAELGEWIWGKNPVYHSNKFKIMRKWIDLECKRILTIRNKRLKLKLKVLAEVKTGKSIITIAKNNGVAFQTVYKWLREENKNAPNSKIPQRKK